MRILISNDDGINAEGIIQLRKSLEDQAEVFVVAPDRERSATGHKITMHRPLRVKEQSYPGTNSKGWAVDGTPSDCVKLGLEALLPVPPDLVVAGINLGPNLGTDVLYSGTVSAAIEGIINDVPAIAISLASYEFQDFTYSGKFIKKLVTKCKELHGGILLNINIPPGVPRGIRITKLGNRRYTNVFYKRTDPRGGTYFWMAGEPFDVDGNDPDTDVWAVNEGFISITPVHYDLTNYTVLDDVKNLVKEFNTF
ncbi:5'/3'-nucleotidase SurE [Pelotomaculum sp. PtaB.Bin117]|uniref:5'/3'-nucleotidase SurE n=1 Tax=Pelotomaculum sp. PtaB.Bin117 TaxID=1811694 RepID=UPI0009D3A811|nr:5'/3'-nucleotidase SurE [Pelotomaculum sp. PtaB.Bin117]OPX84059.1 MAG: 5'-nucleotidase SurE [Pelotomaculum sp. PtaB.Bin117]OPY60859.1 MAG: 5'-nucleotidase SurE [Pelotomaculum sp. PtaU1.Bin065]